VTVFITSYLSVFILSWIRAHFWAINRWLIWCTHVYITYIALYFIFDFTCPFIVLSEGKQVIYTIWISRTVWMNSVFRYDNVFQ
jgi:hypothetical protein